MRFEFNKQNYERVDNFKGGEKYIDAKMFFDGKVRILIGRLIPGATIGKHLHETNGEVIFIRKGTPLVIVDGKEERLEAGNVHYCPKGSTHTLINDTDCDIEIEAVIFEQ